MLIVKVYVNNRQIDQINIHNTGKKNMWGETLYEVVDNQNKKILQEEINHYREAGYRPLLINVLQALGVKNES